MAAIETIRIKDIPTTATTAAADDYVVIDGATNKVRKGLASNLITPASHLTAPDAHGFGVYTVAQLNAFTSANRPIGCVFCSDCLTPEGVGSPVVWSGTQWMCTCASIPATTDMLTFFRALRTSGKDLNAESTLYRRIGSRPYGVTASAGNGGTLGLLNDGETMLYGTGTANNGYAFSCTPYFDAIQMGSNGYKNISHLYSSAEVYIPDSSSTDDIFAVRGVGFIRYDTMPNVLAAHGCGLFYDPQNAFGLGNTGGIANWLAITRNASVQSMTDTGIAPTSTFVTRQILEALMTPTTIRFFIAGTEIGSIPQTNIPATAVMMQSTGIVKLGGTTGTASRSIRARKVCVAARYS